MAYHCPAGGHAVLDHDHESTRRFFSARLGWSLAWDTSPAADAVAMDEAYGGGVPMGYSVLRTWEKRAVAEGGRLVREWPAGEPRRFRDYAAEIVREHVVEAVGDGSPRAGVVHSGHPPVGLISSAPEVGYEEDRSLVGPSVQQRRRDDIPAPTPVTYEQMRDVAVALSAQHPGPYLVLRLVDEQSWH